jgi:hypothetical protein
LEDQAKFGTDSEALYNHIDVKGIEDALETAHGAYALTYFKNSVEERSFNMIRNDERPLVYSISPDKKTLVWASEAWMILVALEGTKERWSPPKELAEHTLYTIDMDGISKGEELVVTRTKMKHYTPYIRPKYIPPTSGNVRKPVHHQVNNGASPPYVKRVNDMVTFKVSGFGNAGSSSYIKGKVDGEEFIPVRSFTDCHSVNYGNMQIGTTWVARINSLGNNYSEKYYKVDQRTLRQIFPVVEAESSDLVYGAVYKGFNGIRLSKAGLLNMTANGCGWCADPYDIDVHKPEELFWTDTKEYICGDCKTKVELHEIYPQLAEK